VRSKVERLRGVEFQFNGHGWTFYRTTNSIQTTLSSVPTPVNITPFVYLNSKQYWTYKVSKKIKYAGISSSVDLKNNNLNYKIRDHSLAKIPVLLICGKKEVDSNSVTIRRLDTNKQENMDIDQFLKTFSALNKASSN